MSNPFTAQNERNNRVNRNTVDMSFQWNGSLPFGRRTPVFCQEVLPGDSVRIEPMYGLRSLPMPFPTQTRVRASLHFFYVRNRTLWKDWQDFIFHTKEGLELPYLASTSPVSFDTGSLSDQLGVPTVIYDNLPHDVSQRAVIPADVAVLTETDGTPSGQYGYTSFSTGANLPFSESYITRINRFAYNQTTNRKLSFRMDLLRYANALNEDGTTPVSSPTVQLYYEKGWRTKPTSIRDIRCTYFNSAGENLGYTYITSFTFKPSYVQLDVDITLHPSATQCVLGVVFKDGSLMSVATPSDIYTHNGMYIYRTTKNLFPLGCQLSWISGLQNPFLNGSIKTSALPYRAYESIFNAFYRNQQIDPFKVDGQVEYNKFIPTDAGGADDTLYDYHHSYWEMDAFTSCLPSPQQGNAPMVGVTPVADGSQLLSFKDEDGRVRYVTPHISEDGTTLESIYVSEPAQDSPTVLDTRAAFTQGFVINDLRNVNALQKYLELSQRKGYRYRDLMQGHHDVSIRYDELNYPEFLGGSAKDMHVNTIVATAKTDGDVPVELGDYAGNASFVGDSQTITKYCDEHGFIVGILTLTPVPVYTQSLKPYFFKRHYLDFFTPEFANVGMQPVKNKMVSPLQFSSTELNETFGYQRPWWDYVRAMDEAHGLYRTELRSFMLHRTFKDKPKLSKSFIECRASQLNDIFTSTLENEDKFFGEILFKVSKKTSVPFLHIPSL